MTDYVYLCHHGILGQKWGVRRYQNADGTLTAAGKKRYYGDENVGKAHAAVLDAKKAYRQAVTTETQYSYSHSGLTKETRDEMARLHKEVMSSEQTLLRAEEEYKGSRLKAAGVQYRQKMLDRYKDNPQKLAEYKNMSDKEIEQEFVRRENIKKALIAGAAVVGTGTAIAIALRLSRDQQLKQQALTKKPLTDAGAKHILDKTLDDVNETLRELDENGDITFKKGFQFRRQVAYGNYDLTNENPDALFVATNKADRNTYLLFLADFNKTGKRYEVSLVAKNDIKMPGLDNAKKIFAEYLKSHPDYLRKIKNMAMWHGLTIPDDFLNDKNIDDAYYVALTTLAKRNAFAKETGDIFRNAGYNAVVDYHDVRDKLTKEPVILLTAQKDVMALGQKFVTHAMRDTALSELVSNVRNLPTLAADTVKSYARARKNEGKGFWDRTGFKDHE